MKMRNSIRPGGQRTRSLQMETLESRRLLARTLTDPLGTENDRLGFATAIAGDYVVVGAYNDDTGATGAGEVLVYNANSGAIVHRLANPTPGPNASDNFGYAVAASGNFVVVGANRDDASATDSGIVYLFDLSTGALVRTINNPTPANTDRFGISVSISGDLVAVGAYQDDTGATNTGSAYVFNATTGALVRTINNPAPASGDLFGRSVAIDDNVLVVGAYADDAGATNAGTAYVFNATTGALLRTLNNPTPEVSDEFGTTLAIDDGVVAVGAYGHNISGTFVLDNVGAAYTFNATTGALLQTFGRPESQGGGDYFGLSVGLSGDQLIVGATRAGRSDQQPGDAYIFSARGGQLLHALPNPKTNQSGDRYGSAVSISEKWAVVGAELADAGSINESGTATLFRLQVAADPLPGLDPTFGTGGLVITPVTAEDDQAWDVAVQSDGRIVAAGRAGEDFVVVRYNVDGTLDTDFGSGSGVVTIDFGGANEEALAVAVQPDGKIIVGGYTQFLEEVDYAIARLNPDGSLDGTFGFGGKVTADFGGTKDYGYDMALLSDGGIVICGGIGTENDRAFAIARYTAAGVLDATFGSGGVTSTVIGDWAEPWFMDVQHDGRIILVGYSASESESATTIARYLANGALDTEFGDQGIVILEATADGRHYSALGVDVQADGRIVVLSEANIPAIVRLNGDGSLDSTFDGDGVLPLTADISAVTNLIVAEDGSYVVVGRGDNSQALFFQVKSDGSVNHGLSESQVALGTLFNVVETSVEGRTAFVVVGYANNGARTALAVARIRTTDAGLTRLAFNQTEGAVGRVNHGSNPDYLTVVDDLLFFTAKADSDSTSLWKTDGEGGFALPLRKFSGDVDSLVDLGDGTLLFAVRNSGEDNGLWKSDGTAVGTMRVSETLPNRKNQILVHDGKAYFAAVAEHGDALWVSDGTAPGTHFVVDVIAGANQATPSFVFGEEVYFTAYNFENGEYSLWATDGSPGNAVLVANVGVADSPGTKSYSQLGAVVYFVGTDFDLWKLDDATGDVTHVREFAYINGLAAHEGHIYFSGAEDSTQNFELWRSNGTAAGTQLVKDIHAGPAASYPYYFTVMDGELYFTASDATHGDQLWTTDGTEAGTARVSDVPTLRSAPFLSPLTAVNGYIYFMVDGEGATRSLWRSDGTQTTLVTDIFSVDDPNALVASSHLAVLNGNFYFAADDGRFGTELWKLRVTRRGDYDGDGVVDGADMLAWQRNLGATSVPAAGTGADWDTSGAIDAGDLEAWMEHFGVPSTTPPAESIAAGRVAALDAIYAAGDFSQLYATDAESAMRKWRRRR